MMIYTNKFSVATDDTKSELILNFMQQSPIVNEKTGEIDGTNTDLAASVVMTGKAAMELIEMLKGILDQPAPDNAE